MATATAVSSSTAVTTYEGLCPDEMFVDEHVQRFLRVGQVDQIASNFNEKAVGTLVVSRRSDGRGHVMDGQARRAVLQRLGLGMVPVTCEVHEGLTRREEAALFLTLNKRTTVDTIERFRIEVIAGVEESVKINNIAVFHGFQVSRNVTAACHCIQALRTVYRGSKSSTAAYPQVLDTTMGTIAGAWGTERSATREAVLGVGMLLHEYGEKVDTQRLTKALAKLPSAAGGLVAATRSNLQNRRARNGAEAALQAVQDIYNASLRQNSTERLV